MVISTGEFYRNIRTLNPKLRICCFDGSNNLAGLYYVDREGYQDVCGVDKGYVTEYTEWDSAGHIIRSGWRRVYLILLQMGLTTREKVLKICPGFFLHWSQAMVDEDRNVKLVGNPIADKITKFSEVAPVRRWLDPDTKEVVEGTVLTDDQNLEIAADIHEKDSEHEKEKLEKERWFLQTWQERGGNNSDKPNY